ncbi:DUF4177 domain-containing protein [Paracoccus onubensis]|uniref:DUF4177 domain-containing protein n=1 Tax=Paracoccus onubensis TaxID=1675788 RepID=A0A418SQI0_9RHOB|nr:DUF4177 domain-containing protein [Paracoccus onubensis]RJE83199.1 DUF4177 domain-containing protein [Paracoccus onubensis]
MQFEYTAIPAPTRGEKAKDAKTPAERYALALSDELNRMAADGWEYIRADVLPSEERTGLTGRSTVYHNLLIFRRATSQAGEDSASSVSAAAAPTDPAGEERREPEIRPVQAKPEAPEPAAAPAKDAPAAAGSDTAPPARND